MAKKLNKQELKDGLLVQRTLAAIQVTETYTKKVVHYTQGGKVLCGFEGQLYKDTNLKTNEMPRCAVCKRRLSKLVAAQLREELKKVWQMPEAGVLHPLAKEMIATLQQEKAAREAYEQPMLPDELLPEGSGRRKGLF